ncbi:MAG: GspH/FimT family pseudopilin [Janthinobacterium lividum]
MLISRQSRQRQRHHGARCRQAGATLIELAIGVTITGILLAAGIPAFGEWLQNTRVRTAAELVQNGLQTARTEAIKRNAAVRFTLTDSSGTTAWSIGCVTKTDNCPGTITTQGAGEGGGNARVGILTSAEISAAAALDAGAGLPAGVTFTGAGRVLPANVAAASDITRADITYAGVATARRLMLTVSAGGQIRMCDPARAAGDPQAC